jgi:hypothetical protein
MRGRPGPFGYVVITVSARPLRDTSAAPADRLRDLRIAKTVLEALHQGAR